ncbi:MAG TPA: MYXO-CTERM sorting domain-containing protein [Polyangiaceae bacterium]|nr:MYXO-CTERM sorting domain-containing protein [Polyangiaceae bacterium]
MSQLLADPDAPDHLYLRSTFGLLVTRDQGATWDFLCEEGMGYRDVEPPMAILPGGTILLALPEGVSRSDPSGCDFSRADGIGETVVDLARVPSEPKSAVAVSLSGAVSTLWASTDEGRSFAAVGKPIDGLIATTVDVATTDADRIYLSGLDGTQGVLLRSGDRGETFKSFPVPNTTTGRRPYIAAVDATDENTVYVRLVGVQGELQVTRDGGKSFETLLDTTLAVKGFAVSPDGSTVLASNDFDGTFRASTSDYAFERISCGGHACLSWSDAGLFGCGDDMVDGYIVGRSEDDGTSFTRLLAMPCVRGPLECDPSTSIGAACPAAWTTVSAQLGVSECESRASRAQPAPYTGCFAEGGSGDTTGGPSGGSGGSGGTNSAGRSSFAPEAGPGLPTKPGCDCRAGNASPARAAGWLAFSTAWLARRRRRARSRAGTVEAGR